MVSQDKKKIFNEIRFVREETQNYKMYKVTLEPLFFLATIPFRKTTESYNK